MNQFVKKASSMIDRLSDEEIIRIIDSQNYELKARNSILEHTQDAFLLISSEKRIIYVNKAAIEMLSLSERKKYKNILLYKVLSHSEILDFVTNFINDAATVKSDYFEIESQTNEQKTLSCQASKINEIPNSSLFIFRDITFLNKFKDEFRKNESLANMTTMAAGVAHEIKNPLASISIHLQLIDRLFEKKGTLSKEDVSKYLNIVSDEVERINSIVVDFLYAVKPMNVKLKSCNINDIVKSTLELSQVELDEKNIKVSLHLGTTLPKIFADFELMKQAVLNLIMNAMQAMEESNKKEISISTYIDGDTVKLSISDTGCGMTDDQMSKIFEPYFTTKNTGTGLGLTNLYKIIKQHGADVNVHSTLNEGSEFILLIPVPQTERFKIGN